MSKNDERPNPRALRQQTQAPNLGRHERLCTVCQHPDRAAIEEEFIHWRNPRGITERYGLADRASLYRHAHATGLFARRKSNVRWVLESLLERADEVPVTATSVVRAVRAYTHITDSGEWMEPPSRVIVTPRFSAPAPAVPARPAFEFISTATPDSSSMWDKPHEFPPSTDRDPYWKEFEHLIATEDDSSEDPNSGNQRS